jgi:hypothetical protein
MRIKLPYKYSICVLLYCVIAFPSFIHAQDKLKEVDIIYYYHVDTSGFNEKQCTYLLENLQRSIKPNKEVVLYAVNSKELYAVNFFTYFNDSTLKNLLEHNARYKINNPYKNYYCMECIDSLNTTINNFTIANKNTISENYIVLDFENVNWLFTESATTIKFFKSIELLMSSYSKSKFVIDEVQFSSLNKNNKEFFKTLFQNILFI